MLEFLKKNGYSILKLFLIQIGMTVFGLMLTMATASNLSMMIVSCIATVILYMYLLYGQIWEVGAKDQILTIHQGQKPSPMKGFLISLCANALNILLAALIVLSFYNIPRLASGELTPTQLSSGNLTGTSAADKADEEAAKEWTEANVREYESFVAETPAFGLRFPKRDVRRAHHGVRAGQSLGEAAGLASCDTHLRSRVYSRHHRFQASSPEKEPEGSSSGPAVGRQSAQGLTDPHESPEKDIYLLGMRV